MSTQTKLKNTANETMKAGCVVMNNQNEVLLVTDAISKTWTFPKGHVEEGEGLEETARREVKEETGYSVGVVKRLSDAAYTHGKTGELIRVAFFLAKPIGLPDKPEAQTQSTWYTIEKARGVIYWNLAFLLEETTS